MLGPLRRPALASFAVPVALAGPTRADEPAAREPPGTYAQLFATSFVGDGPRFNNPYRLATPLGSSAESVSRTAAYADLGAAVTLGNPAGLQHGVAMRMSFALEGVRQAVLTPAYLAWKRWRAWAVYGRAGLPIVLSPDATWGLEAGGGAGWFGGGGGGVG